MCDICSEMQQMLISNDLEELKSVQSLRKIIEIFSNFLQLWSKSEIKYLERFNSLTQEIIYTANHEIKSILKDVNENSMLMKKDLKKLNRHEFTNEDREKLFHIVAKIFLPNFPLYVALKHAVASKTEESFHDSNPILANLNALGDLQDSDMTLNLIRNMNFFYKFNGVNDICNCFQNLGPDKLPISIAHALCSIVNNLKRWNSPSKLIDCVSQLKSRVSKYLCKLSDQDLRLDQAKNMADFMWKDPMSSSMAFDTDGLNLALKYFNSSTLTMRLYGITQINNQISLLAELCSGEHHIKEVDESPGKLADWLSENDIIALIFGPNLHIEIIKQSHIILNFLAMEKRITIEHITSIWQAAQLKHCSKTVYDLLPTFIKNLGIPQILHLYNLLSRLEPKDHSEQTLHLSSTLIKFIWSRGSLSLDSRFLSFKKPDGLGLQKCNTSSENSAGSIDVSNSEDEQVESSAHTDTQKSEDEEIINKNFKRFRASKVIRKSHRTMNASDVDESSSDDEDDEDDGRSACKVTILKKNSKPVLNGKRRISEQNYKNLRHYSGLNDSMDCVVSTSSDDEEEEDDDEEDEDNDEDEDDEDKNSTKAARLVFKRSKNRKEVKCKRLKSNNNRSIAVSELATSFNGNDSPKQFKAKVHISIDAFDNSKNLTALDDTSSSSDICKEISNSEISNYLPKAGRLSGEKLMGMLSGEDGEHEGEADGSFSSQMSNKSEKNMADFDEEESCCEEDFTQFALQAQLASEQVELANKSETPLRFDSNAISCFNIENVCQPGNTLIWDLLQDNKINQLSETIILEAEKILMHLLCYNCDKNIRVKFIEGCLNNLAVNRSVIISLRLLPKLFMSFQQFRNIDSEQLIDWAEREHQMMSLFFSNLKAYCAERKTHDSSIYSHQMQIQVRLHFLTQIFALLNVQSSFRLTVNQVDILWECLVDDPECADELFSWFLNQLRQSEYNSIEQDGIEHLYVKLLPNLNPENVSMICLSLFQHLCNVVKESKSGGGNKLQGDDDDSSGTNYMWSIALRATNTDVSMAAIQYINSYFLSQKIENEKQFISQCMTHLNEAAQCLKTSNDFDSSLQRIQRGLLLLNSHLEVFCRRYAYHLRRWKIEKRGINSHICREDKNATKINVMIQPGSLVPKSSLIMSSTDSVADLRAEVAKWWESITQCRKPRNSEASSSSLLSEGFLRLITQGQELNVDCDEKTLAEVGFKEGQLVYVSLSVVRNLKKAENYDISSILHPPPREYIPTLLLMKPENFEKLFNLMHQLSNFKVLTKNDAELTLTKAQILSRKVWDILVFLPTSPTLLDGFENLNTEFENLFDSQTPHKLLYSLYIVDSLCKVQYSDKYISDDEMMWSMRFIVKGGFKYLLNILMSKVLQESPIHTNEWAQDCLTFLLKLIYELGTFNPYESSSSNRGLRKDKYVPKFDAYLLRSINIKETMNCLISILEDIAKPYDPNRYKTSFWGRDHLIHNIMSLVVSWFYSSDNFRQVILQSKNLITMLNKLVLDDPDPTVRNETSCAIYHLCFGQTDKNTRTDFEVTMMVLSELLKCLPKAEMMRHQKFDSHYEDGKEPYGPACRDYFWLLSRLVSALSKPYVQDCFENPKSHLVDFNELVIHIKNSILSREILEKRHSVEDNGLIGLLNLMTNLLKFKPAFQISKEGLDFVSQAFELLFGIPTPTSRHFPKCKSKKTRTAVYDLLFELVKGAPDNYNVLHKKLLEQHIPTNRSPYPWDYWPRDDGRSESGYVGLTNLGATCYMASCLQHLYMMPKVRAAILKANLAEADLKHIEVLKELQKMFTFLLESERKAYNPRNFCKVYMMDNQPLNTGEQKDMAEFFIDLVSKLEEMSPELKSVLKDLFCGLLSNNVVSLDCHHVSRNVEDFYTVRCRVADMRNLYDSLNEVTVKDTLEGDNMYTCSQCGKKVRAEKRACFKRLPEILCFNTMRYSFNMLTMLKEKINTHFPFPMRLNMEGYMEKRLMPQHYEEELLNLKQNGGESSIEQYEYDLIGVTVHTGNADGGHYYSFIKDRISTQDKWLFFNDAEVKPFDPNQIPSECFGGEMTSKTYDSTSEKFMDFSFEKSNSAYMLFYERCSSNTNETNDCAASSTTSGSVSPVHSVSSINFEMSQDLEDWILKDNVQFIQDKNIFDHTYFSFVWEVCSVIPQSILPLQSNVTELATQLSTSFFIETFIHSKEKPTMVQWVELITKQFNSCQEACQWFLDHMAKDTWWPVQVLIKCPNQMVRQMFQRLCIHVIQKLRTNQHQLYLSVDNNNNDADSDTDNKISDSDLSNIDPERIGNASPVTRFMKSLLSLMEYGAKAHLKHLTEYFSLLFEFSRMGEEETKFLNAICAIHTMVQFYLGNKTNELNESSDIDEEEEDVVSLPSERHKPASLDKMITLVASLVEKSRNSTMSLQLSTKDYGAIAGGKGFPYIYQQIKDNINLQQTRNLIHSLCKDNEPLATHIVNMLSQTIISTRNAETNQSFFKIFTLITEMANGSNGSDSTMSPCFTHLVLQKVWEAADFCPYSALDWLSVQVTRSKLVHQWVLQSLSTWVEHFLLAHNNQRVRSAAVYLLLSLIPNSSYRQAFRTPHRPAHKDSFTEEALSILHQIYAKLLQLLNNAKIYTDTQLHGTSKLTSYFSLMTYFLVTNIEKLMLVPYFEDLWTLYHPLLSEPPISTYHNKQALLVFWYNACVDCPENIQCILQNEQVLQHIPFNYIYADHDNQDVIVFNRTMLPAYYGLLRLCCEHSREFTRTLANHSNLNWAFTNIAPHPTQYSAATDELFKLMNLFVTIHEDANEQEVKEIKDFKRDTLLSYLKGLDCRTSWATIITSFQVLITSNDDRMFIINNNGLQLLFDTFQTLHMMYHEATACHITSDMLELLTLIISLMNCLRNFYVPKDARRLILDYKEWLDIVKKLTTLLNTYNSSEMRTLCINALKEFVLIIPHEVINLIIPLFSQCHTAFQNTHNTIPLGSYFPRRGQKVPVATAKNLVRPIRPMIQMVIPHSQIELGFDEDYDIAVYKFYAPYHEFIDLICRIAININCFNDVAISLNAMIGYESIYLHMTYFPKLWMELYRNKEHGRHYIHSLITMSPFIDYIDAIIIDDRKCLVIDCIFYFVKTFLPRVARKVITKQVLEILECLQKSLPDVINSLLDRQNILNLIGDFRAIYLIYLNHQKIPNCAELKNILLDLNNKLTEMTGTTINEGMKPEEDLNDAEDEIASTSNCNQTISNNSQQLVRKIVLINLSDEMDFNDFQKNKDYTLTIEEGLRELQTIVYDNLKLIERFEAKS